MTDNTDVVRLLTWLSPAFPVGAFSYSHGLQSDGLAVLAGLEPLVVDTAARAARGNLDNLGSATMVADIAAMNHETQYSRLFRS